MILDACTLSGIAAGAAVIPSAFLFIPSVAHAAEKTKATAVKKTGMVETQVVGERLHRVPLFSLTDETGVPFTVFGEDAIITAYFFTTYDEAARILKVAKDSGDKARKEAIQVATKRKDKKTLEELEASGNPWAKAQIRTVPLDFAVTLSTRQRKGGQTSYLISPDQRDTQDALALDTSGRKELPEGRVPLFYFEGGIDKSSAERPLFFRKSELLERWNVVNPGVSPPELKLTELFSTVSEMVRPGTVDEELRDLVFVVPKGSAKRAEEIGRSGRSEFKLGQRIVVF